MSDLDAILTLEEAAAYLHCSPLVLNRLASGARPKIASLKTGGAPRTFPESAIAEYIEANTTPAAPQNSWGLTDAAFKRLRKTG
jgi:hypothetical protein